MDQIQLNDSEKIVESKLNSQTKLQLWLKSNLFKDWKNAILTIVTLMFSIFLLTKVIRFLATSEWSVVTDNLRLLFVGQFPAEEIWRLWVAVMLISLLLGLSWGIWKGIVGHVAISIGTILLVFGILPYTEMNTKIYLFSSVEY